MWAWNRKSSGSSRSDYDAVVIGSGPGGLTAALCLARAGKRVLVLEQHYLPGGWSHTFNLEGYDFSPGVHYIGEMQPGGRMRALYEGLGVASDLTMLELNPEGFDHVRIGSGRSFDICRGRQALTERLKESFPHQVRAVDRWMDIVARMSRELEGGTKAAPGLRGLVTMPARIPTLARYGLRSVDHVLARCGVTDPELRAVLTVQAGDHGMPTSTCPMGLHAAIVGHYFEGGYYPKGGARAIPKAFIKALRRHGGEVRVRAEVERVLMERGRAIGVRLVDGAEIRADIVVSNADPGVTYGRLVGPEHLPWMLRRRLRRTTWSLSAISLFLAVDIDAEAAGLDSGNYWHIRTPDVDETYRYAADPDPLGRGEVPGVFLTVTSLKDRSKRPQDASGRRVHTMESFTFVSHEAFRRWAHTEYGARPDSYVAMKEEIARRMHRRLDELVPGLSERIVFQEVGTPLSNRFYCGSTDGNLYGIEKRRMQVGPFAYPVTSPIEGLYLCGASTMGHGVAGASISGVAAARAALGCRTSELLGATGSTLTVLPSDDTSRWPAHLRPRERSVA